MRTILSVAAAALVVGLGTSTVVIAQTTGTDAAKAARAQTKESLQGSYDRCVSLAKSRGYASSDLDGNRTAARTFVINCMRGKQR